MRLPQCEESLFDKVELDAIMKDKAFKDDSQRRRELGNRVEYFGG